MKSSQKKSADKAPESSTGGLDERLSTARKTLAVAKVAARKARARVKDAKKSAKLARREVKQARKAVTELRAKLKRSGKATKKKKKVAKRDAKAKQKPAKPKQAPRKAAVSRQTIPRAVNRSKRTSVVARELVRAETPRPSAAAAQSDTARPSRRRRPAGTVSASSGTRRPAPRSVVQPAKADSVAAVPAGTDQLVSPAPTVGADDSGASTSGTGAEASRPSAIWDSPAPQSN